MRTALLVGIFGLSLAACRDKDVDPFDDFGADFADDFDDDFAGDSTDDESTTADDESTSDDTTADESTTAEESTTADESTTESSTDGNGFPDDGTSCTSDDECMSNNCYLVPFLGGTCGECNEDADCPDGGCTAPNVFDSGIAVCNVGEFGGGCETTSVCMPGLVCANVLDLLGLIQITTCGECDSSSDCSNGQICAPVASIEEFGGANECIAPGSLPQDAYCLLDGNGDQACNDLCSTVDMQGLAEIGACGECNTDGDCGGGNCIAGEFDVDTAVLTGSICQ